MLHSETVSDGEGRGRQADSQSKFLIKKVG